MQPRLIQLVTVLLLIAQGWLGMVPGKMVCVPLGDCVETQSESDNACEHTSCSSSSEHRHGPVDAGHQHTDDQCPHIHVPGTGTPQTPNSGESDTARRLVMVAIIPVVFDWRPVVLPQVTRADSTGASRAGFALAALKSTRLLI
jgi:hypothetical protein